MIINERENTINSAVAMERIALLEQIKTMPATKAIGWLDNQSIYYSCLHEKAAAAGKQLEAKLFAEYKQVADGLLGSRGVYEEGVIV